MTITNITRSPEPCTEAGWIANQYYLSQPVSKEFIIGEQYNKTDKLIELYQNENVITEL